MTRSNLPRENAIMSSLKTKSPRLVPNINLYVTELIQII